MYFASFPWKSLIRKKSVECKCNIVSKEIHVMEGFTDRSGAQSLSQGNVVLILNSNSHDQINQSENLIPQVYKNYVSF